MQWMKWFAGNLTQQMTPQDVFDMAVEIWPKMRERIPHEQRVIFLKSMAEKHLGTFIEDLSREERITLMNNLLPLIAREFPLTELDFLTAFPLPEEEQHREISA